MGLFGVSWGTIATVAAVGVSFLPGGPVVSGLIGAGAGAIQAMSQGKGWEQVLESTLVGGALGAIPGGLIGGATRGLMGGGGGALARSFGDIPDLLSRSSGLGGLASRLGFARAHMERPIRGALAAGISTGAGLEGWNKLQTAIHGPSGRPTPENEPPPIPDVLPVRPAGEAFRVAQPDVMMA